MSTTVNDLELKTPEAPCMAKLTVFVKEYRGDNAVVFVQTDQPGLPHYPFMVPIRELSHFSAIRLTYDSSGQEVLGVAGALDE